VTGRAWAALLFVGGVWGASFLFVRVALDEVSPLQVVLFRTIAGAAVLSPLLGRSGRRVSLTPLLGAVMVALALVSTVAPFFLISWAETRISSGTTAILNATMPIFTLVLAAAVTRDEQLSLRAITGGLLGIGGVAVLSGGAGGFKDSSLLGVIAVVGATACYSAGNVTVRALVRTLPATFVGAANIVISALIVAIISMAFDRPVFHLSWDVWGSLLALGVLGTGAAYIAYYWLIEHAGSYRSSLVTYVIPVVAVFLGAVVLGEDVGIATVAGGLLIILGVAMGTGELWGLRRQQGPAVEPIIIAVPPRIDSDT
jgi:drug/metabolite transporter (DMT)-like permease